MLISKGGPLRFQWSGEIRTPVDGPGGAPTETKVFWSLKSSKIVDEYHYLSSAPKLSSPMNEAVVFTISEDLDEIRALLKTLRIGVVKEFLQKRTHPHKASFLGPGKIDEVAEIVKDLKFDMIVVNGVLKPSQHHSLEMKFQTEAIDRTGVILRIFADHAHTPEAIAQVTLAKLRYELPFLREWIHKAKSGDRPGFLAGGAYATDVYFEHAKTHAKKIESTLEELSRQRETTRTRRRAKGYTLVSLAGYTNAGKSALMNRMCNSAVDVDDRLFSTLSTTTRKVSGIKGNVLMSDTVGFIKDLPPDLIDAFNSTLEEIFYADLVLLAVDTSEDVDTIKMKLQTSLRILLPKIEDRILIVVGNKIDLIDERERKRVSESIKSLVSPHELVLASALTEEGLDELRERIVKIQGYTCHIEARLPLTDGVYSFLSHLRSTAEVDMKVVHDYVSVSVKCKPEDVEKIINKFGNAGATQIENTCDAVAEAPQKALPSSGNEGAPL